MNNELTQLEFERRNIFNDLEEMLEYYSSDLDQFRARISELSTLKKDFSKIQTKIEKLQIKSETFDSDTELENRNRFKNLFFDVKSASCKLNELDQKSKHSSEKHNTSHGYSSPKVNLPPLSLPEFRGEPTAWNPFFDLFDSLINKNENLSDIEKFRYLLLSLRGEPYDLIKSIPLTADNYVTALEYLQHRYENKRIIATKHLDKILDLEPMSNKSHLCEKGIRNLLNVCHENLSALRVIKFPVLEWDFIILNIILRKLSTYIRKRFEQSLHSPAEIPQLSDLFDFLEKELTTSEVMSNSVPSVERFTVGGAGAASAATRAAPTRSPDASRAHPSRAFKSYQSVPFNNKQDSFPTLCASTMPKHNFTNNGNKPVSCSYCHNSHSIQKCDNFSKLSITERSDFVKNNNICFNCLIKGHNVLQCRSRFNCKHCNARHHSSLHDNLNIESNSCSPAANALSCAAAPRASRGDGFRETEYSVLLATAVVDVRHHDCPSSKASTIRVLIDPGSQTSLITEACVQRLGLSRHRTDASIYISGVGQGDSLRSHGMVCCDLTPHNKLQPLVTINAHVISKITSYIPNIKYDFRESEYFTHIRNLPLADSELFSDRSVELLLGGDYSDMILLHDNVIGPRGTPVAINSIFGYLLSGRVPFCSTPSLNVCVASFHTETELRRFWELEEVPETQLLTVDEQLCESIFDETHTRDSSGRYSVALPFKPDAPVLGRSRENALFLFHKLENRLLRNPSLRLAYHKCLQEYLDLGHMELASDSTSTDHTGQTCNFYYLPHHCVVRKDSATTKVRVVFNASCKTTNGQSLNDNLLTGPKLQQNIVTVLLKFRIHNIVFTSDIKMMYRFINIHEKDREYQRILWRTNPNDSIRDYRLCTVTFGVSSAPYLALRVMRQLAFDEGDRWPRAKHVLLNDVFVDDVVTGAATLDDAFALQRDLIGLCQAGGFELRKWTSNHPSLLASLAEGSTSTQEALVISSLDGDTTVKVLGLKWTPKSDMFSYDVHCKFDKKCTKRSILSEISKIFDPLGFLSPVTIIGKILIQSLWASRVGWEETPPPNIINQWYRFVTELSLLSDLSLPRQVIPLHHSIQIHGFSDASEKAYSAAVYIRLKDNIGRVFTSLIIAKTKIAPLARLTIPRLELLGALILSKLIEHVVNTYKDYVTLNDVYAWTDSSVVLAWLQSHESSEWRTFISNRLTMILSRVPASRWRHVRSADNPADAASRGVFPSELNRELWFSGPAWLKQPEQEWPQLLPTYVTKEERRTHVLATDQNNETSIQFLNKYSKLGKLIRVVSYIFRFYNKCLKAKSYKNNYISIEETKYTLDRLILLTQSEVFYEDIQKIKNNKTCSTNIQKLKPFIDDAGFLRVGGRIQRSNLDYEAKHQLILPKNHFLTYLIIDYFHVLHLHVGPQTLQFLLSQRYWILSARDAVRHRTRRCIRCFRTRPAALQPPMAPLPAARVRPLRPFLHVGVDYAGYFQTKVNRVRNAKIFKTYVCVFVCLSTKAIHLELVPDLTTQAFFSALRRFTARRGLCSDIYSDCGRNFVGCDRYLKELFTFLKNNDIQSSCANLNIRWHFQPPYASHMGGIFEAGVKSFKQHLHRVVGSQILTYDEFNTLLCQIEAVLNSRPLSVMSSDPTDPLPITPSHFLIGEPLTSVPEYDFSSINCTKLDRWRMVQQMYQHYWKRWSREYLQQLQQRVKWFHNKVTSLPEGTVVLVQNDFLPPMQWQLARVHRVHPGRDGIIRVVTLRMGNTYTQRPVVKICPLPIED